MITKLQGVPYPLPEYGTYNFEEVELEIINRPVASTLNC